MSIFARFKATGFTAVKCVIHSLEVDNFGSEEESVKAHFKTFEDALIFSGATLEQYEDRTSIVHVDIYCNKSGNRVYNAYR